MADHQDLAEADAGHDSVLDQDPMRDETVRFVPGLSG